MADDNNSPSKPTGALPSGQPPVERRMLLAFALVALVLMVSQFLFKPVNQGPKQDKPARVEQAKAPTGAPPAPSAAVTDAAAGAEPVSAQTEQLTTVDTKVFRIVFSNKG